MAGDAPPAPVYTTDHSPAVLQTHAWRSATNSAAYLVPHLRDDMTVLDVGCGPGSITLDLAANHVPRGHVTGLEYVPEPLEHARTSAAARGVANASFRVGDVHCLPFPDGAFDVVHAHQVLQHVADPVRALREMRRVAKPGGLVACRESAEMAWYPASRGIAAWRELTGRMGSARGGNPHPGSRIHVWAEEAGFAREDVARSAGAWCFSTDEERRYWGGSMEERARSSGLARTALAEGFASADELQTIADGWRAFQADGSAWFGLLHGEILCRKR